MKPTELTIVECRYHSLPDYQKPRNVEGLTVGDALKVWRGMSWGDIGTASCILEDCSYMLTVELHKSGDGNSRLTATQEAVLMLIENDGCRIVRRYRVR